MKIKRKTESITIRISPERKQEILRFADENHRTITEVLELGFLILKEKGLDPVV